MTVLALARRRSEVVPATYSFAPETDPLEGGLLGNVVRRSSGLDPIRLD